MSSEEKRAWVYAAVALAVPVAYFATVLARAAGRDVAQVAYVRPMLVAIGVGIVANMVLTMLAGVFSPKVAHRTDERDAQIGRWGDYAGFYVMSIATIVPLGLAMAEVEHFWIAQSLYLAFVLAAFVSAVVKIVAYRRGF